LCGSGEIALIAWLYLVLAHVVADFLLQPYELVRLKAHPVGLAIHAVVHGVITAILVAPILPRWWLIVPLLVVVHYLLDWLKVARGPAVGPLSLAAFLADQAAHLLVLAIAVMISGVAFDAEIVYASPAATAVLYYAIPYLTVTVAGAILIYQVAVAFRTRPDPNQTLVWQERLGGMIERVLALTIVLYLPPRLWALALAPALARVWPARQTRGRWVEAAWSVGLAVILGVLFRS
jgi:hypothetical protein